MLLLVVVVFALAVIFSKRQGVRLVASIVILIAITVAMSYASDSFSTSTEVQNVIDIPKNEELQIKKDEDYFSFYSASFSAKNVKSDAVDFVFVDNTETTRVVINNKTFFYDSKVEMLIDFGLFTKREWTEVVYTLYIPKRYITSILPPTGSKEDDKPVSLAHKVDVSTC